MKSMLIRCIAVLVMIGAAGSARSMPIDFNFSFTDTANGAGDVTGIIRGLFDDTSNQQATSVEVLSVTGGFGVGEYVGNPSDNSFDVAGGLITSFIFFVFGNGNTSPAVTCCSLRLSSSSLVGLTNEPDRLLATRDALNSLAVTPVPVPVPAPATLALFGLGLAGLGWVRRKKA